MPIAKKTLKIGFVVAALPGTYVTKAAVAEYGWKDDVDDGPDIGGTTAEKDNAAPKGKPQKGA